MADKVPDVVSSAPDTAPVSSLSSLTVPTPGSPVKDNADRASPAVQAAGSPAGKSSSGVSPARDIQKSASPAPGKSSPNRTSSPTKDETSAAWSLGSLGSGIKAASPGKTDTTSSGSGGSTSLTEGSASGTKETVGSAAINGEAVQASSGADVEMDEAPATVGRDSTMKATAKEGAALLKNEQLEGTRTATKNTKEATSASKPARKPAAKRENTMAQVAKEAAGIIGNDAESMPRLRSATRQTTQPAPKAPPKPAKGNTMKRTAAEGKALLEKTPPAKRARK